MMPQIDFDKTNGLKINLRDKEKLIKTLNFLKNKIQDFLPALYQTITDFESIKNRQAQFITSQIKLVINLLCHLPKNKYDISSKISASYLQKIIENIENNNYFTVSSEIPLWYNSIIEIIPMDEKDIDIKQIAMDFKNKGNNAVQNPKQVKDLNQLFVDYSNYRFKDNSELSKIPFIIKYLQQIFKEVSYDGGVLFNEESYDSFTINFGKTCENIGIALLDCDTDKVFKIIVKLYDYTFDLKEVLHENKISKYQ